MVFLFVFYSLLDQNRMPKLASYFECQTHLAKKLRNSANFIIRNLRIGLKKDPDKRTANENEVNIFLKRIENKQKNHPIMPTSDHWMLTYET